jgi:2-amino-4-hydroxy-6-hydroxymethyldihydropteridine diphosphokinase
MNRYIISLGSNIEPSINIQKSTILIKEFSTILAESEIFITKPEGYKKQSDFHNCAVLIETNLNYLELKQRLGAIEIMLKRTRRNNKNGPRTIDLDISTYNGHICNDDYKKYWFVKKTVDSLLTK